jgi:heterodisulfide reductase subunit A
MAKGEVETEPIVAFVRKELCIGCRICERTCDFGVITMVDRKAQVNEAICKGCGACAAACPTGAMQVRHFTDEQIYAMIEAALRGDVEEGGKEEVKAEA